MYLEIVQRGRRKCLFWMQNEISCCQNDQLLTRWDKTFSKIYKGPCLRLASYRSIDNNFLSVTALPSYPGNIKLVTYIFFSVRRKTIANQTHSDHWLAANDWVSSQYFPRHVWEGGLNTRALAMKPSPAYLCDWPAKLWAFELRMFSVVEFFVAFYRIRTLRQLEENLAAR